MIEIWIFTALAAALFSSSKSIIQKHLTRDFNSIQIGYVTSLLGLFLLMPLGIYGYLEGSNSFGLYAVGGLLFSGIGNIAASYLFIEAVSITDISKVSPIKRLTPVIVAVFEPLILGITYSVEVLSGALLTFIGGIIVVSDNGVGKLPDLDKGVLLALIIPVLYSFMTIAERYATQNINPFLFTFIIYVIMAAGFTSLSRARNSTVPVKAFKNPVIIGIGFATSLGSIATFYTLSLISASHFTILKQSSILFSVIIGGKLFKEKRIISKIFGSLMIILGIILTI
jgi:drug/metabolite transporter (DMT)-like permease